jgi:GT2 family glycosyltransferase
VSVIIPTFNRRASLARLIDALAAQAYPADRLEVLVVDDGSTDGTPDWVRTVHFPFPLRLIEQAHAGPGAARNRGVAEGGGELILFLDDDVAPDPGLISAHVTRHRAARDTVVIGPMLPPSDWPRPSWIRWEERKLVAQYRALDAGTLECTHRQFYTGNASLPRDWFVAARGFDPSFVRAEDVELGFRLSELGVRFAFEPSARVRHYAHRSFAAWRRIPYQYGQADVAMRDKGHWVLKLAFADFHRRNLVSRGVARFCVGSGARVGGARVLLGGIVRAADAIGLESVASASLSVLFNLLYWQGVSDGLGGPDKVWNAIGQRRVAPSPAD